MQVNFSTFKVLAYQLAESGYCLRLPEIKISDKNLNLLNFFSTVHMAYIYFRLRLKNVFLILSRVSLFFM